MLILSFRFCICRCKYTFTFILFERPFYGKRHESGKTPKTTTLKTPIVKWQNFGREKLLLDIKIILNQASAFLSTLPDCIHLLCTFSEENREMQFTYVFIYSFTLNIYFPFSLTKGWIFLSHWGIINFLSAKIFPIWGSGWNCKSNKGSFSNVKMSNFLTKYFSLWRYFNFHLLFICIYISLKFIKILSIELLRNSK